MNGFRIDNASQLQTLETARRLFTDRRLPSKSEAEYLLANISALIARVEASQAHEAERERARQIADFDDIMGGGE